MAGWFGSEASVADADPHGKAGAADALDRGGDLAGFDAGPGGDEIGLAARLARAGGLTAQRDGGGAGAAGRAERDLDQFGIRPGAEGVDQGGRGGAALFVGFDGEGFQRIGDGHEGLRGDGAGGGDGGRVRDGGEELCRFQRRGDHRLDPAGGGDRRHAAGADGLADGLGRLAFAAQRAGSR